MNTRTNIVLDDDLIAKAMARAHVSTKKAAVDAALRAFVREPDYSALLALEGSRLISDDYDPKGVYMPALPKGLSSPAGAPARKQVLSKTVKAPQPATKRRKKAHA
ncbi:MAG: type II toxin-antitoxin system VapB family antitoxin [Burkholderiaceae bacterium]